MLPLLRSSLSSSEKQSLRCCVRGTSVVKRRGTFLSSLQVLYHIKVRVADEVWVSQTAMDDILQLHAQLLSIAKQHCTEFTKALSSLPCPKEPLFKKTEMLVIKGMCGELEHYLLNLVKLCERFDTPDVDLVEAQTLHFLKAAALQA
ncbi:hypothetical protein SDRG_15082 [Saprolegnia diclina VS20]|uniref:PX domain-containing protein n=1 Tax=Saprolegnia diclina (strain VS20) TaxID=1156394 RepID=T0RBY2_SAPDV|nr:hypothetical protein SDRG_15082 [Saprolegnia diclina VS20]EQC27072.1 hypothetical protein SDRG_15082 [Saprolegnia diclina VS20]|eukprot:XP_008619466.1 hypothetical protein SDRG_15082 [Saprolegnia diclina VS20]